jgi:hypothetical protein
MAEPTTFPEEHVQAPIVYRRLSIMAIVSCVVAVLFALALLLIAVGSLRERVPVQINLFFQFVPVCAALLGLVALVLIRRSEGVLAGAALARLGLWVGTITALGYWAYWSATYLATCQQSNVFATRWITRLRDGKIGYALLDIVDPKIRQSINPEDEEKLELRIQSLGGQPGGPMAFGMFRRNKVVKPILQSGRDLKIEPLAVSEWEYKNNAFHITRGYRLTAPEVSFEIKLATIGAVSPTHDWQGREWRMSLGEGAIVKAEPTALGNRLNELRFESTRLLESWGFLMAHGNLLSVYMYSLPLEERKKLTDEYLARLIACRLAAASARLTGAPAAVLANLPIENETEAARNLFLPGYDAAMHNESEAARKAMHKGRLFHADKLKADDPGMRENALAALAQFLGGPKSGFEIRSNASDPLSSYEHWKYENGLLELPHDFVLIFGLAGSPSSIALETTATLEAETDPDHPSGDPPQFRVRSVQLVRAQDGEQFRREMEGKLRGKPESTTPSPMNR